MWTFHINLCNIISKIAIIGFLSFLSVPKLNAASVEPTETKLCEFYKDGDCDGEPCNTVDECSSTDTGKYTHCYTLWETHNDTGKVAILMKGCFIDTLSCKERPPCKVHNSRVDLLYCCCDGDMCNQNNTFPGYPPPTEPPPLLITEAPVPNNEDLTMVLVYILAPLTVLTTVFVGGYLLYRHKKMNLFNELPTAEPSISSPPSPSDTYDFGILPVVLTEVRARGRFGAVWSAKMNNQDVAVKVFPVQDKQSWMSELEIFRLPKMTHPNILQFMGVDKKGDNLQSEYWLITAYHEKGSLCDYLKAHTLTWQDACRIAVTMARGLTHLHEESQADLDGGYKPAIAHRDFKSKNVLLKADMSACIADFGLALVFQPGKHCGDTHGQVGTRRYMAPEVLEGAINFTKDAFLRIDMYACGLVLWEIVSRCVEGGCGSDPYRLPLEEEVGSHPSLEEMQDAVVLRKLRPQIKPLWRSHMGMAVLCDTMEECWDHDAEARLSASCVLERIAAANIDHAPLYIEHAQPLLPPKDYSN